MLIVRHVLKGLYSTSEQDPLKRFRTNRNEIEDVLVSEMGNLSQVRKKCHTGIGENK